MRLDFTPADEAFRDEVRAFLSSHLTDEIRERVARSSTVLPDKDLALEWQQVLVDKGWAAPQWPSEWGGIEWTATQQQIFATESARAGAPGLIALGLRMLAPVLLKFGTEEQKRYYLPRILSGEHYWCQGYSEPGSGSDLSSLRTRAVRDGDDYVVNGSKIWTTHAHFADHIFCLVRTNESAKAQSGISFLLIDMATQGVSVRPIITLAGDHEVNQVFFDNVRVPKANRVGPENQGWTVAKYLLEFERGGLNASTRLKIAVDELHAIGRVERDSAGGALADDPDFVARVSAIEVRIMALEHAELETLARVSAGESPGPNSSLLKNLAVDIEQEVEITRLEAIQYYGLVHPRAREHLPRHAETATAKYLNGRAASIYGGSKEVQKNIIAKRVLGL